MTDLKANGSITTPRGTFSVTGKAWKDHEWSTSSLGEDVVGWDWFSLQLADGREIMYAFLRKKDNTFEEASGGTLVYPDGATRPLSLADVKITPLETWTSPDSGAIYPAGWNLAIPGEGIDLQIKPLLPQQELRLSTTYWEGAVEMKGTQQGYGYRRDGGGDAHGAVRPGGAQATRHGDTRGPQAAGGGRPRPPDPPGESSRGRLRSRVRLSGDCAEFHGRTRRCRERRGRVTAA